MIVFRIPTSTAASNLTTTSIQPVQPSLAIPPPEANQLPSSPSQILPHTPQANLTSTESNNTIITHQPPPQTAAASSSHVSSDVSMTVLLEKFVTDPKNTLLLGISI